MSVDLALPEYDVFEAVDGEVVEVKRPRERVRHGRWINGCRFCDFVGRAERGKLPRPSNRPTQFCPSCRGGIG